MLTFTKATPAQVQTILKWAKAERTKLPTQEQIDSWSFDKAAEIIRWYEDRRKRQAPDYLMRRPQRPQATEQARFQRTYDIPDGRYALQIDGDKNEWSFFQVRTPEEGKWAGYTFADQVASANEWPVKGARRAMVLARIAANIEEALANYGKNTDHCGLCGRELHNDESKARGIGPRCAAKAGL